MRYRTILPCLLSVLMTACGGGGGSDPAPATPPATTPPPPPPPPFALTEANAVQAAAYALAPIEQLLPAGTLALNAAAFMRIFNTTQFSTSCGAQQFTVTYTDRDGSQNVSVGDVINVPAADCGGMRRAVTFTLTQFPANLQTAAGRAEVDIQVDSQSLRVAGAFNIAVSAAPSTGEVNWNITNALVTVTHNGTTQTVRLGSGSFTFTPTSYSYSLSAGSVESEHLGGSYTFATTAPLAGNARRLPTSGVLELSTSGGSRARVTPPATPGTIEEAVEYSVAAAGDFAAARQTVWTAIVNGSLFSWRPNEAPTLTNVVIQPADPSPGTPLWVSYNAADINGDGLETTIEWRRNGTVIGTEQVLYYATVRNDQITVSVTVSDGRLSATATASAIIGNPPPQLLLTLEPAEPDTTHDLVATTDIYEPDGDPVTTTYEWSRGGVVIGTGPTLPASETSRGQTISVRVTASDGTTSVEATASTTIVDSPARLTVSSAPTSVVRGAPVTFAASVEDPDGDPVDQLEYVLAYGPAGMTVDGDTGVVEWIASGPMFDRVMDINWGITVAGASAVPATGTIQVTDSSRDYPLLRYGTRIPAWPTGLSSGDFDDDGDSEVLVIAEHMLYELESDGAGGYRQSWAYPYSLHREVGYSYNAWKASVATGDVDGDDRHEIFTAVGGTITKLDGVERRAVATRQLAEQYAACTDLLLGDLESDGQAELLCLSSTDYWPATSRIIVLRASDLSIRNELPQAEYGRTFALGNVDEDAALELVTSGGYVLPGPTLHAPALQPQWHYTEGFGEDVDTGDLDGDGIEEIIATGNGAAVTGFSATLRSPIWEAQRFDVDALLVADVDGDARPEILVGDGQWGEVAIYRYNAATNTADLVSEIDSQEHGVTSIAVADLDEDGTAEIVWGSGYSSSGADVLAVAEFDSTLALEWSSETEAPLDPPFVGGELAGSALMARAPLFLSSNTAYPYGSRLVRLNPDGALEASEVIGDSYYGNHTMEVVDYDNDTSDEAFIGTGYPYGGDALFRVHDFFSDTTEWSSGAQQSSIAAADVTRGDLTGDGRADLVGITTAGIVYVYNVATRTLVWQSTTLNEGRKVLVANVDGDAAGELEIVAVTTQNVFVYRRNTQSIPYVQSATYSVGSRTILDADVGDTDGDGNVEILLLVGGYSMVSDVVTLNGNLQPETTGNFTLPWEAQTLAIEPSASARKNLLMSRVFNQNYYDGTLVIVGSRSGGIVYETPQLLGVIQRDSVHYVTLPGETEPRVTVGTTRAMYLTQ